MAKPTLVFLLCCFGIFVMSSQEKDSTMVALEKILANASNDSLKVEAYIEMGDYQLRRDLNNVELYLNKALKVIQFSKNSYDYNLQNAKIAQQFGVIQRKRGNYNKALQKYYQALPVFETYKDSTGLASSYHNIGVVQTYLKGYSASKKSFRKAIAINTNLGRTKSLGKNYNSLSITFSKLKQRDSALYFYDIAEKNYRISNYNEGIHLVTSNKAGIYYAQKKYEKALELYLKNFAYVSKIKRKEFIANSYFNLAGVYYRLKEFDSAFSNINRCIELSKLEKFGFRLSQAYKRRSRIYREIGDYKSAMRDYVYFNRTDDSIVNFEKVKKASELELNYKLERERLVDSLNFAKQKEFLVVENEKESLRKRWYLSLAILAFIIGFLGIQYFRRRWKASRDVQAELNRKLYRTEEESQQRVTQLNSEIDSLSHEIHIRKEEITELMTESLQHLKTKEKLVDDLKKLASNDTEITLQNIIADLKSEALEDSRLTLIKNHLEELNYDFFKKIKIKHPNLTKIDLEICSYLRLSLGRQEIAKLRFTSVEAVKKSRNRLRKKMNLSPETDLEAYVKSI
jgi:tetratricopeptide (TPR) repeat protein